MGSEISSISSSRARDFFIIYSFVKQMKSGVAHFAMLHGRYGYDLRDNQVQNLWDEHWFDVVMITLIDKVTWSLPFYWNADDIFEDTERTCIGRPPYTRVWRRSVVRVHHVAVPNGQSRILNKNVLFTINVRALFTCIWQKISP